MDRLFHLDTQRPNSIQHPTGADIDGIGRQSELLADFAGGLPVDDMPFKAGPSQRGTLSAGHFDGPLQNTPLLIPHHIVREGSGRLLGEIIRELHRSAMSKPVDGRVLDNPSKQVPKASSLRLILKLWHHATQHEPDALHDVSLVVLTLSIRSGVLV